MCNRSILILVFLTIGLLANQATSSAMRPGSGWDDGYRTFQEIAPEYVEIEVQEVKTRQKNALWFASSNGDIFIKAKVVKVYRTEANLRPNLLIPILYSRKKIAGTPIGNQPLPPEVGEIVPAFLKYDSSGHFEPAARHHSFSSMAKEQLEKLKNQGNLPAENRLNQINEPVPVFDEDTPRLTIPEDQGIPVPASQDPVVDVITSDPAVIVLEDPPEDSQQPDTEPATIQPIKVAESSDTQPITVIDANEPPVTTVSESSIKTVEDDILMAESAIDQAVVQTTPQANDSEPITIAEMESSPEQNTEAEVEIDMGLTRDQEGSYVVNEDLLLDSDVVAREMNIDTSQYAVKNDRNLVSETQVPATTVTATASEPETPALQSVEAGELMLEPAPETVTVAANTNSPVLVVDEPASNQYQVVEAEDLSLEMKTAEITPSRNTLSQDQIEMVAPVEAESDLLQTPTQSAEALKPAPSAIASSEPSDAAIEYAEIFMKVRQAETLISSSDQGKALTLLNTISSELTQLKEKFPEFQPFMVEYRHRSVQRQIEDLQKNGITPEPLE
ncbi:MAG: hypothetical protein AAFY98_07685 [Verrucomicrobiota bacterium]